MEMMFIASQYRSGAKESRATLCSIKSKVGQIDAGVITIIMKCVIDCNKWLIKCVKYD